MIVKIRVSRVIMGMKIPAVNVTRYPINSKKHPGTASNLLTIRHRMTRRSAILRSVPSSCFPAPEGL
ncbi:MAG: hypothetical protein ACOYNC_00925 [Bacteroidales bacterium]